MRPHHRVEISVGKIMVYLVEYEEQVLFIMASQVRYNERKITITNKRGTLIKSC